MKIAINCLNFSLSDQAGPDVYLKNLLINLAKIDKVNNYYLIFSKNANWPLTNLGIENTNFKPVYLRKIVTSTHTNLAYHLLQANYDIYFTSYHTIPIIRHKHTSFVSMIHGLEYQTNFRKSSKFHTRGLFEKLTIKSSNKIIVPSNYVKESIKRMNWIKDISKVIVVPEGVSEMYKPSSKKEIEMTKLKFKIQGDYLFFVSTIQPRKNIPALVQAFAHLIKSNKEFSELKLVISGKKGWEYEQSYSSPKKFNIGKNVIFTGHTTNEDLINFYSGAKAYVNFSLDEGFGLTLLEAFSCNTLCCVSNISAFKEVGATYPFYADPTNYMDMSYKMQKALFLPEQEKKATLYSQAQHAKKFSWEITAQKTLSIFQDCVK